MGRGAPWKALSACSNQHSEPADGPHSTMPLRHALRRIASRPCARQAPSMLRTLPPPRATIWGALLGMATPLSWDAMRSAWHARGRSCARLWTGVRDSLAARSTSAHRPVRPRVFGMAADTDQTGGALGGAYAISL